ncbi:MAG: HD domain-containing protein, partial [Clostridia bacterium]|nr:HD domain-containing protein [Clostridia bacterium]
VIRRFNNPHDLGTVWRPAFVRDIDKIMNCPYYNRYADKTQVFSFYKNDDITRRGLHVQLVSRIARTIGGALNLNLDLIEAIALGHDIGHTPFGHAGERFLDALLYENTGRHFSHNIHSVRVLDGIYPYNISLQTLSGIASHDGELELSEYRPAPLTCFEEFDRQIENCYVDKGAVKRLVPSTLEGCVVRISDIIAYLGKDRQDAERAKVVKESDFDGTAIGNINAEMINNLMVNIIENSYGKDYIKLDSTHFEALQKAKRDNYELVYKSDLARKSVNDTVEPMMYLVYRKLLDDLLAGDKSSPVFTHHIDYVNKSYYKRREPYENSEPNQIIVDYIASMTDDYFIDLFAKLFTYRDLKIEYKGYFEQAPRLVAAVLLYRSEIFNFTPQALHSAA